MNKPGRNDPCPCGSGKKYKKCCLQNNPDNVTNFLWKKIRQIEQELIEPLIKCSTKYYEEEAILEAWDEFSLWSDVPMDPENNPEIAAIFMPWFLYHWFPDTFELDNAKNYPEDQIAITYLNKQSHGLSNLQKRFIQEACTQPFSFFVVNEVNPGQTMLLKDLFLERQVLVYEQQASSAVNPGDIIFACVVTLDGTSIILGCAPILIPSAYHGHLIDVREYLEEEFGEIDFDFLHENDTEIRDCYFELKEAIINPLPPDLRNTDNDPLQPTKLYYELICSPDEVFQALKSLAWGENEDSLLSYAEYDRQNNLQSVQFPWMKKGNKTHQEWNNTVLGHIVIDGNQLIIDVNSENRADEIKRKITRRLGKRAVFKNAVIESIEKMLEERGKKPDTRSDHPDDDLQNSPEVQEMLKEMADKHWEEWLDHSLPALKNKTPREAAKTKIGRERLEALFMQFSQIGNDQHNAFAPDVDHLRQTLGME